MHVFVTVFYTADTLIISISHFSPMFFSQVDSNNFRTHFARAIDETRIGVTGIRFTAMSVRLSRTRALVTRYPVNARSVVLARIQGTVIDIGGTVRVC